MIRRVLPIVLLVTFMACGGSGSSDTGGPTPVVPFSSADLVVGTGPAAANGQTLTVNYTGWIYSSSAADHKGTMFQTTVGGSPYAFVLGVRQVIPGGDQGVAGMQVGGRRELVIPPNLAYGSAGSGAIPPNATLIFDIDLLSAQ